MIWVWLKIILAICLIWPRGYLLIYLIDRSKNFSFGFKFFTGWLIGLVGFTLDVFATNVFGGFELAPWVFVYSAVGQIFGFGLVIFIFERKIPWPNLKRLKPFLTKQIKSFFHWSKGQQLALGILILIILAQLVASVWRITNIPVYDLAASDNSNLKAEVIYTGKTASLEESSFFDFGDSKNSPLFDPIFKVWLAQAAGSFEDRYINLASVFYYLMLLLIFYFSLPLQVNRWLKLLGLYLLSSLPLLYFYTQVSYIDLFFSVFLFLTIASFFYYLAGAGNSFFYFSGIALAFSLWIKNDGLWIIFPFILATTLVFWLKKKYRLKQLFLYWLWPVVTIFPWLVFRLGNRLDTFSDFNWLWSVILAIILFKLKLSGRNFALRYLALMIGLIFLAYNSVILLTAQAYDLSALAWVNLQLVPLGILFLIFCLRQFFGKIKAG
ncbi:MAG: hypothetical protein WC675_02440 [Patescibacteria group bacterium]|jgi:hypothetical protein